MGCHFLLQGIFPTQSLNPSLASPAWAGWFFTTVPPWKPAMNSSDSIKFWKKQNCGDGENITGCQGWECGEG